MRRVISVYLPTWPTDRLRRNLAHDVPPKDKPLVTSASDGRRQIVAAVDHAARALGLYAGMPLAQAHTLIPALFVIPSDPDGDSHALNDLAAWCLRYAPLTAPDQPDGLWIDATGVTHLFGGEANLLRDIVARLSRDGITVRLAMADTPGAAWAIARYGQSDITVVSPGDVAAALRPLPIKALRLSDDIASDLMRMGFDRIDQLIAAPRAPLTLRFGSIVARRLDQALGHIAEPIEARVPPDAVTTRLAFLDPLLTREALASVIHRLTNTVSIALERRGQGARRLDLVFERVDRTLQVICVGTARASRHAEHLAKLLIGRLEHVDPGFGIDAMRLSASVVEQVTIVQPRANIDGDAPACADLAVLVDRLSNRLGVHQVYRVAPVESDVPERSVGRVPPLSRSTGTGWPTSLPRPVRLLKRPQPVDALAMLPDHPPVQFIWRHKRHRIRRADGPERIAGEWWRHDRERQATRDYWQVEDEQGRRFWLYRSGDAVDPATGDLRWYLHGIF